MWTPILLVYVAGEIITAVVLLGSTRYRHGRVMNAASIVLWPIYWSYFVALLFLNRKPTPEAPN